MLISVRVKSESRRRLGLVTEMLREDVGGEAGRGAECVRNSV